MLMNKLNYFYNLPNELQKVIYEYDPTFRLIFDKIIIEFNRYNYPYKEIE